MRAPGIVPLIIGSLSMTLAVACTAPQVPSSTTTIAISPTPPPLTSTLPAATNPGPSQVPTVSAAPVSACVRRTYQRLTPDQRLGQLIMVGLADGRHNPALVAAVEDQHLGGFLFLGRWSGSRTVSAAARRAQAAADADATGGVKLLVAADQEGGAVVQLRGAGFTSPPSALKQGSLPSARLTSQAAGWARQLRAAGVNVNLAPVADTVPAALGRANGPIGRWGREYGHVPATVSPAVMAFVRGMRAGGVEATVKHFPGLGRVRNNPDLSATGITDAKASADDPYLGPFRAGIDAGARLVMVSSARYPRLDPDRPAMFSPAIVTDLLRGSLGYAGVVITDDVAAKSVASVPAGDRGVRAVAAGVDIVLSGGVNDGRALLAALRRKAAADAAFAAKAEDSAHRVLTLKEQMGLLTCGSAA